MEALLFNHPNVFGHVQYTMHYITLLQRRSAFVTVRIIYLLVHVYGNINDIYIYIYIYTEYILYIWMVTLF